MIDIEKAKKEFLKYVSNYNGNDESIENKKNHSLRVMEYSKKIAESLNLSNEQIELATLIGLLHDIARFEQKTQYKTFSDISSRDHGDWAVEILEENNFIRNFIDIDDYDEIIKIAVKNHNKYKVEENLNKEQLLHSKIIRDADKLDIFYEALEMFWKDKEQIERIENSSISEECLNCFLDNRQVCKRKDQTQLDSVMIVIGFVFDLNFIYSKEIILEKDYINKILNKFDFKNNETKKKIGLIRKVVDDYLKNKLT